MNQLLSINLVKESDVGVFEQLISIFQAEFEMEDIRHPSSSFLKKLLKQEHFGSSKLYGD